MNPPYPDHDCPACDRGEKTTTPPVSSTVGSMPVHSPSGQVCQKYIDPELLKILEDSKVGSDRTRCSWVQREGECDWESTCGYEFYFTDDGGPSDHSFNYCPKCGKTIEERIL